LLFGFLGKQIFDNKKFKGISVLILLLIIIFHVRYTTVFEKNWRSISDLKEVGKIISQNMEDNKTFNIATIQKENDRWDRNAVDYRYFTETFYNNRALDWYPQDYQNAEILFVVDKTGISDPVFSNIMEIEMFKPDKIIGRYVTDKGIVIYKINKKQ
jgi:hypothetical protein